MAITQQLARLPIELLERCRSSVAEIDAVCGAGALSDTDYLDLDWSPTPLERLVVLAFGEGSTAAFIRQALNGKGVVNPAYTSLFMLSIEPVTCLEPSDVAETATQLCAIDRSALLKALTPDREEAIALIGPSLQGLEVHPSAHLEEHLRALQTFYDGAAEGGLAMMMWWD